MIRTNIKLRPRIASSGGFTLVEILVAMVISGIIVAAIYSAYTAQSRTYLAQEQVAQMQQNVRAGLMSIRQEVRMAGYDPTTSLRVGASGITTAQAGQISFTQDIINSNGTGYGDGDLSDAGETIDFGFSVADDPFRSADVPFRDGLPDADSDGDGVPDAVSLCRQTTVAGGAVGGYKSIAENIQAIEFRYLDASGANLGDPSGTVPQNSLANIRSIQISILARAGRADRQFTNASVYCPASNPYNGTPGQCTNTSATSWGPYNDNFRRLLLITTVNCRNMGL